MSKKTKVRGLLAAALATGVIFFAGTGMISAQGVFSMGGTLNPTTGTWTGLASLSFVTVGNPSNVPDPATGNLYGSVPYTFQMSTYDVTLAQYTAFLNAVSTKSDPYGLYNAQMASSYPTLGI